MEKVFVVDGDVGDDGDVVVVVVVVAVDVDDDDDNDDANGRKVRRKVASAVKCVTVRGIFYA